MPPNDRDSWTGPLRVARHAHYLGDRPGGSPVVDEAPNALVFTYPDSLRDHFWELDVTAILADAAAAEPLLRGFSARVCGFLAFLEPERWGAVYGPTLSRVLVATAEGRRERAVPGAGAATAVILNLGDSPFSLGGPERGLEPRLDLAPNEGCLAMVDTSPCIQWGAAGERVDVAFLIWKSR